MFKGNRRYSNIVFVIVWFMLGLMTFFDRSGNFSHFGYSMSFGKKYWIAGLIFIFFSLWWGYYTLYRSKRKQGVVVSKVRQEAYKLPVGERPHPRLE